MNRTNGHHPPPDLAPSPVIFVRGILQRSGTNYLSALLQRHPDCLVARPPVWEDFLLSEVDRLEGFVRAVSRRWYPGWGVGASGLAALRAGLGDGLQAFLEGEQDAPRVVAKTPSVEGLQRFFDYFPRARLLILVRDGRAVVSSGMRSFRWDFEEATRRWRDAARIVREFERRHPHERDRFLVVRYEDLWRDLDGTMTEVLRVAGLDAATYDWEAARAIPLRGSSILRDRGEKMDWRPVERTRSFDPLSRFSDWTPEQHRRFNWLAGEELEALGYEPLHRTAGWDSRARNLLADATRVRWRFIKLGRQSGLDMQLHRIRHTARRLKEVVTSDPSRDEAEQPQSAPPRPEPRAAEESLPQP